MGRRRKPKLAVWKFASCDGCQLTLLDCEDELLALAARSRSRISRKRRAHVARGPYDLSLVEGSITTPDDLERIREVRRVSKRLVTIGACATAGGIQALRNFADVKEFISVVYAQPAYIATLATSTAIAEHVPVDFELRGCPINKAQLLEVVSAFLAGRPPAVSSHSVCVECKIARHAVRDGRARDALPGTGDACRVRRHLPRIPARVLRMLRPDGSTEHRCPGRGMAGPGRLGCRRRAGLSHVQCGGRAFRAESEAHEQEADDHG